LIKVISAFISLPEPNNQETRPSDFA